MNGLASATAWVIPAFLFLALAAALWRGVDLFDAFAEGVTDGLRLVWQITPYVLGIYAAIAVFRASGLLSGVTQGLAPVLAWLGLPGPLLPLALVRPLSGSAATGLFIELLQSQGPDSDLGRLASVMQGSSETTFYVLTVYLGAVGIKNPRYAVAVCLLGDLAGFLASVVVTAWYFGH